MAREFNNKGGKSSKPAGRGGSRSGGKTADSSRSGARSGGRAGGKPASGGRSSSRDGEKRPYAGRGGAGRSEGKPAGRSGARAGSGRGYGDRDEAREYKPRRPREDGDRKPYARREDGERPRRPREDGDRPRRPREDGERSYGRKSFDDKPARGGSRSGTGSRSAPRSGGRSFGDRDRDEAREYKPRRPREDGERKPYARKEERSDRNDRSDRTPRRYMRDDEGAARKPRREASGSRFAERKPFKGRFSEDNENASWDENDIAPAAKPRERKPKLGEDKLSAGRLKVGVKANLWGQHAVKAAWMNPERTISALYTTPEELKLFAPVMEEARNAGIHRPEPTLVGREDLDKYLPRDAVHQGVAINAAEPEEVFIQDILTKAASKARSVVVILDQVTDPHNVGAIIRSACALGADGVIMQRRHAPELTGVVAKAASGAIEHVAVAYETNLSRSIEALQAEGYIVAGLDERGEQTVDTLKSHEKLALVLGAEGPGLRHLVKEHCDILVKIRMDGPIPSLNVSNAATVALYAALA